jgi:HEAT repeat protein/beta-lactamase regulating signal transducer with metallopeptidase domain
MIETLSSSVLAWLLTYLIHSTVLLGLALLLTRLRAWPPVVMDLMWKTALVGGLVTASVQLALEVRPAGSVALRPAVELPASVAPSQADEPHAAVRPHDVQRDGGVLPSTPASASASVGATAASSASRSSLHTVAVLAWWLVALALGLAYAARRLILVGRIGDRDAVHDDRLLAELDLLTREAGLRRRPRLTSTARISSPIALGVAEICVPETALTELDLEQQRSMLAHELAHLARRDPLWLAFASVVERVLWIQPLNRVARRQVATAAEYLCDEWAVRRTGSGVALARCLAQVAEWIQSSPLGVPVAGMAEERSLLVSRVEKLLAARAAAPRSRRALLLAAAVVVLATIAIAPSVTGSAARASSALEPALESPSSESAAIERATESPPVAAPGTTTSSQASSVRIADAESQAERDDEESNDGIRTRGSGATRDSAVVAALISRLKDESAEVRRAAANALGKLEDSRAVPALIAALSDDAARVRAAAADALGNFHDPRAVNRLSALLGDPDREVRKNALEALSEYEAGVPASAILPLTRDPDAELRHAAAHALGKLNDRGAGSALAPLVRDPSPGVRSAAIESLARLHDAAHASVILPALGDSHADVRRQAIEALEEMRSPIPEATLLALLRDPSADVRAAAADLAGERSVIAAVPSLRRLLDDPNDEVREQAVSALGDIADEGAAAALRAALDSKDAKVRRAAAEALGERRQ